MKASYISVEDAYILNRSLGLTPNGDFVAGHMKPFGWFRTIVNSQGYSDFAAQDVLAEIVRYSSAKIVPDPQDRTHMVGMVSTDDEGWFPFPYSYFCDLLNMRKVRIRCILERLEALGIIERLIDKNEVYIDEEDEEPAFSQNWTFIRIVPGVLATLG